jgi:hypothetical protein
VGKDDIDGEVTQNQYQFTYDEIADGTTVKGKLTTEDELTAGTWSGEVTFSVSVVDTTKVVRKVRRISTNSYVAEAEQITVTGIDLLGCPGSSEDYTSTKIDTNEWTVKMDLVAYINSSDDYDIDNLDNVVSILEATLNEDGTYSIPLYKLVNWNDSSIREEGYLYLVDYGDLSKNKLASSIKTGADVTDYESITIFPAGNKTVNIMGLNDNGLLALAYHHYGEDGTDHGTSDPSVLCVIDYENKVMTVGTADTEIYDGLVFCVANVFKFN